MSVAHPRRTTKTPTAAMTPSLDTVIPAMSSLRKGATFHTSPLSEKELPLRLKTPSPPRRAQSTLEDVVDAHKRRVALTLTDIERSLAAIDDDSSFTNPSFRDESDPISKSLLDHAVGSPSTKPYGPIMAGVMPQPSSIGRHSLRPRINRPARYSDATVGSSRSSRSQRSDGHTNPTTLTDDEGTKPSVSSSAITRSAATPSSTIERLPKLSARATSRIQEHILKPLLAKPSLKDFHTIVNDCPRRINDKEVICLRDLEKTLIFMAPKRAKSIALYLDFCLTSIRCIQATVEFLSEREQTRPHDRPYTNGYFVDLVAQIKQYAQQVQVAKEKEAKGEKLGEMDPESTDEVRLHGGLTKNGRPAELVRVKKNGKAISIATGLPVDLDDEDTKEGVRFKRSLSNEAEEEDAIMRSMARRKRSASAAELAPKRCREPGCTKEFKRPCDLTKHEKTHSRPWKCPVETCKYHDYGWPTEKEMDRHHNDKHSSAPPLFECHFKPCPYRSKRESNCKQHMEKAHGWEYVRSKNNGKNRDKEPSTTNGLPTPQSTNAQTPSSDGHHLATPERDFEMNGGFDNSAFYEAPNFTGYSNSADMGMFETNQVQLDFSPISDLTHSGSSHGNSPMFAHVFPAGQDQFGEAFPSFNANNVDFSLFDNEDLYSAQVQLPTPSHETYQQVFAGFQTSGIPIGPEPVPHLSPVGQGKTMLFTPTSMRDVDESFEDFAPAKQFNNTHLATAADFQLFPSSTGGTVTSSAPSGLFGEVPNAPVMTNGFPGVSAQDLLDFYARTTAAALNQQQRASSMEWSSDGQHY